MKLIIGFSKRSDFNLLSKTIMLIEKSNFSHAYIRLQLPNINRELIYQASGLVVNFQNLELFNNKEILVKEFQLEVPDDKHIELMQFMVDNVGVPYGMKELFGILLIKLFKLKNNPFASKNNTEICCKLAAKIIEILGIKVEDPDNVDLVYLYNILEAQSG